MEMEYSKQNGESHNTTQSIRENEEEENISQQTMVVEVDINNSLQQAMQEQEQPLQRAMVHNEEYVSSQRKTMDEAVTDNFINSLLEKMNERKFSSTGRQFAMGNELISFTNHQNLGIAAHAPSGTSQLQPVLDRCPVTSSITARSTYPVEKENISYATMTSPVHYRKRKGKRTKLCEADHSSKKRGGERKGLNNSKKHRCHQQRGNASLLQEIAEVEAEKDSLKRESKTLQEQIEQKSQQLEFFKRLFDIQDTSHSTLFNKMEMLLRDNNSSRSLED